MKGKQLAVQKGKFLEELEGFIKCLGNAQTSVREQTFRLTHIDVKVDILVVSPTQYSTLGKVVPSSSSSLLTLKKKQA